MVNGSGGIVGKSSRDKEGEYTNNDIPGANDDSEAYERDGNAPKKCKNCCDPAQGTIIHIEKEFPAISSKIEVGEAKIIEKGSKICVIRTRTLITKYRAIQKEFKWYNCRRKFLFITLDNWVELEKIKEKRIIHEEHTELEPIIRCHTNWGEVILDLFGKGIEAGASSLKTGKKEEKKKPVELTKKETKKLEKS